MGVAVIIGLWAGRKADEVFDTKPIFFWIGLTLGFGAAVKAIYDAYKKAKKLMDEDGSTNTD